MIVDVHGTELEVGSTDLEECPSDDKLPHEGLERVERPVQPRTDLWFRGGLVFEAHELLDHSTLGLRVIQKKKKAPTCCRV